MPRRGENIYKRKDGRWEGRILRGHSKDRKPRYVYIYGRTYREVKQKMDVLRACEFDEERGARTSSPPSCSVLARQWLESKRYTVKESTYAHYRDLLERYIDPEIGDMLISELRDESIHRYVDKLLGPGGLSAKTVSDVLTLLKSILRYSEEIGCKSQIRYKDLHIRQPRREMRVLSIQEQNQLAALFEDLSDRRRLGVMLSLYTGLRLGEVCALKWEDIDMDTGTISVRATMQRIRDYESDERKTKIVITEPKSSSSLRSIPVPAFLIPCLEQVRTDTDAFVLTGKADKYVEPRSMENYFHRCVKECGMDPANYHSLRHTFATRCVEAGFDIKSLSEILGHSDVSITLNRYVHSSFEQKRKNMDKLTMRV